MRSASAWFGFGFGIGVGVVRVMVRVWVRGRVSSKRFMRNASASSAFAPPSPPPGEWQKCANRAQSGS